MSLDLRTLDVCFLAAPNLRAEQDGLASFEEELVFDVFDQVCDLVEPGIESSRKRATHTIQRLRSQRMLARVDATGIVSAGEYALTSLAAVIVKSFLEDEQLTRESLALLDWREQRWCRRPLRCSRSYRRPRPNAWIADPPARDEYAHSLAVFQTNGNPVASLALGAGIGPAYLQSDPQSGRVFVRATNPYPQVIELRVAECVEEE